ncbi:hypothetical protein NL108_002894 [Boleophthalmus pectinirostris]|nr:hypothetical protein NL108_002894 [Boleophthalmus pectinirostris]
MIRLLSRLDRKVVSYNEVAVNVLPTSLKMQNVIFEKGCLSTAHLHWKYFCFAWNVPQYDSKLIHLQRDKRETSSYLWRVVRDHSENGINTPIILGNTPGKVILSPRKQETSRPPSNRKIHNAPLRIHAAVQGNRNDFCN